MYKLHICDGFGVDGLTSTTVVMEGTREECWKEWAIRMTADKHEIYLVEKPDWSNGRGGYPTRWDDPIDNASIHWS